MLRTTFRATGATMSAKKASISSDEISSGLAIGEGISGMTSRKASLKDTDLVFHGGGRTDIGGVSGPSTFRSSILTLLIGGDEGGSLMPLRGLYISPILSESRSIGSESSGLEARSSLLRTMASSLNMILSTA